MAATGRTPRRELPYPTGLNIFTLRADLQSLAESLDNVAFDAASLAADRGAASAHEEGTWHLSIDTGVAARATDQGGGRVWVELNPKNPAADVAGMRTIGPGALEAAAGNHTHAGLTIGAAGVASIRALGSGPTDAAPGNHTHDDRYYQKATVDGLVAGRSAVGHTHVASEVTDFHTAVRTNRLDQMAAPAATVSMAGQHLTNLPAPTNPSEPVRNDDARLPTQAENDVLAASSAFSAYRATSQTGFGVNSSAKVSGLTEDYDYGNRFDGFVGDYVAPVKGLYEFGCHVVMAGMASGEVLVASLDVDAVGTRVLDSVLAGNSGTLHAVGSVPIPLDAGQTVSLIVSWNGTAGTRSVFGSATPANGSRWWGRCVAIRP